MNRTAEFFKPTRRPMVELGGLRGGRRPSLVALAVLAVVALSASVVAALVFLLVTPRVYAAETYLIFEPSNELSVIGAERDLTTQELVLRNRSVLQPVADATGMPVEDLEKRVSVDNPSGSNILRVTVTDRDGGKAKAIAELITAEYQKNALQPSAGDGEPDAAELRRQVETVSATLSKVLDRLQVLARARKPGEPMGAEERQLQTVATSTLQRLGGLQDRLAGLAGRSHPEVSVLAPARELPRPVRPRRIQGLAIGALVGLFVAAGGALLLFGPRFRSERGQVDYWDDGWR
jgi:uncharacterized protein involved in exopolysaccharide biosynthesis